jgi:hypothetical protein
LLDGEEDPSLKVVASFQSTHTVEKLVAEHQTIDAALNALHERYLEVLRDSSLDKLSVNIRRNPVQLLDSYTSHRNRTTSHYAKQLKLISIA